MKLLRLIPVVLLAWNAYGDQPTGEPRDPQRPQPPPTQQPGPPIAAPQGCAQEGCYDPRANYWCELGCDEPELPFRPEFFGPGMVPPGMPVIVRPHGYYRRMSFSEGCEVQQGNNGEFAVLASNGGVLFLDKSIHAAENAAYMKTYYEKKSKLGLCSGNKRSTWDI